MSNTEFNSEMEKKQKYPVRDYLSVEISIFHHIRHAVGMLPYILLDAFLRNAVVVRRFFLPRDTFLRNVLPVETKALPCLNYPSRLSLPSYNKRGRASSEQR